MSRHHCSRPAPKSGWTGWNPTKSKRIALGESPVPPQILPSSPRSSGRAFDGRIGELIDQGLSDDQIAWELDDELVKSAQKVFLPEWERTRETMGT